MLYFNKFVVALYRSILSEQLSTMTVQDITITKIRQLPDSLVEEVNDFIDFLAYKHNQHFSDSLEIAESDFSDYLSNLENYEEKLARGEIQW